MKIAKIISTIAIFATATGCNKSGSDDDEPWPSYDQASYGQTPGQSPGIAPPTVLYPDGYQPPAGQPPVATPPKATRPPTTVAPATTKQAAPPTQTVPPTVATPGLTDAYGALTQPFLRQEARSVYAALIAALQADQKAIVSGVPLSVIEDKKEVNAYAGCNSAGSRYVAITSPMLTINAATSEAKAYDELFGTRFYDDYINAVAGAVRAGQEVKGIAPGKLPLPNAVDRRKLSRQRVLFDEQVAWVLGHELAHHYRGHTRCKSSGPATTITGSDAVRILSNVVPPFNQPLEAESDQFGIRNALDAGTKQSVKWTEGGALLTLDFFHRLTGFGPDVLAMSFFRTHPLPAVRIPIVQATAQQWRMSQGQAPSSGNTLPLPIPIQIPTEIPIPRIGN